MAQPPRPLQLAGPCALLVNECQKGLVDPAHALFPGIAQQAVSRGITPRIAALAQAFRACGQPVVFIHMRHRRDFAGVCVNNPAIAHVKRVGGLCEGSVQAEPCDDLHPQPEDHVVYRHSGMTVFHGNHLDSLLRNLGIQTLVLAGVSTNVAVPGMLLGGLDRGFHVVVPQDCIAGASADSHNALLTHLIRPLATLTDSATLIQALGAAA